MQRLCSPHMYVLHSFGVSGTPHTFNQNYPNDTNFDNISLISGRQFSNHPQYNNPYFRGQKFIKLCKIQQQKLMNSLWGQNKPIKGGKILYDQIEGSVQAVSEDGLIIVTMNSDKQVFVYYFNADEFWSKELDLPDNFNPPSAIGLYSEEHTPFYSFHPTLSDSQAILFIINKDSDSVLRASMGLRGETDVDFHIENFSQVLDIAIHPSQNCLVILTKDAIHLSFTPAATALPLPSSPSAVSQGKLKVVEDRENLVNYFAFMVEEHDDDEMHIHKYVEMNFTTSYSSVQSKSQNITYPEYEHNRFGGVSYDKKNELFFYNNDFFDGVFMKRRNYFMDLHLNTEKWVQDPNFGPETRFHVLDFIPRQTKLLMSSYTYYLSDPTTFYSRSLCVLPFSLQSETDVIDHDTSNSICLESDILKERVSIWGAEKQFILAQEGTDVMVYNMELQYVSQFEATTFSTKNEHQLMVLHNGVLTVIDSFSSADTDSDLGLILGLSISIPFVCIVFFCVLYRVIKRSRERESENGDPHNESLGQLHALPKKKIFNAEEEKQRRMAACSICLSGGCDCQLSCQHVFHRQCIIQWIKKNASCPQCRLRVGDITMLSKQSGGFYEKQT